MHSLPEGCIIPAGKNTRRKGACRNMLEFLEKEQIDKGIIQGIREYREKYPAAPELAGRVPRPRYHYYGKDVWEAAVAAVLCGENLLLAGSKATGKNVLAEKTFSTTPSEKSTNVTSWKLDAPVKARALRVESANPSQPLALTEVEAYGPEDAEDTPVPAPAE